LVFHRQQLRDDEERAGQLLTRSPSPNVGGSSENEPLRDRLNPGANSAPVGASNQAKWATKTSVLVNGQIPCFRCQTGEISFAIFAVSTSRHSLLDGQDESAMATAKDLQLLARQAIAYVELATQRRATRRLINAKAPA
jgi:hypothetical protein